MCEKRFFDKCDYITRLRLVLQTHTRQKTFHCTRSVMYYYSIQFGYHFSCNWMWCDNLPRLRGKLSQVIFPYKVVINNHSITIEGNPVLFNCSQVFTQNFGISQPSQILNAKNTKILKQSVWQLAPVYSAYSRVFLSD